ncbi:MAG: TerB N-terminal domain-containing protein [Clostridiales bacterium]|nr:TerB N-terminal domain-containing protein [Clostridiales bacterium]
MDDGMYYEIDYDASPIPGVGKFVQRPQKIGEAPKDDIRGVFGQMRDIARAHRSSYDFSRFFDRRVRQGNEEVFYKQAMFMKDFRDDYTGSAQFSQYYPYYQMMGYEQLRTYFTWRTEVRKGNVADTSLSYAFLYIYELLGNIGAEGPLDALGKLMFFWKAFSAYNKTIDKYVLRWLKDYHVYYELPQSFKEFVEKNSLAQHYPKMADAEDNFDLFCAISKYDIRKSAFFASGNEKLVKECFYYVAERLRQAFVDSGIQFDESVFQPTKRMSAWTPFQDALFYQWVKQPDRRIVLSENEIYICSHNKWAFSTVVADESGKQLIGYVMKQMESVLRKATGYKFKLSANASTVTHPAVGKLSDAGNPLESIVEQAAREFYREATKTVVRVDLGALSRIRQEALATQEKLIVPEQKDQAEQSDQAEQAGPALAPLNLSLRATRDMPTIEIEPAEAPSSWESLRSALTEIEKKALAAALHGEKEIKKLAEERGVMLEVLVDGINEKAMDHVGDSLLDEDFALYGEYIKQAKELII